MVEEQQAGGRKPLAVVTGVTGGIGYELAKQFAEHGFDLLITGRSDSIFAAAESLAARALRMPPAPGSADAPMVESTARCCSGVRGGAGVSSDLPPQPSAARARRAAAEIRGRRIGHSRVGMIGR